MNKKPRISLVFDEQTYGVLAKQILDVEAGQAARSLLAERMSLLPDWKLGDSEVRQTFADILAKPYLFQAVKVLCKMEEKEIEKLFATLARTKRA